MITGSGLSGTCGGLWAPGRCSALGAGGLPAPAASPGRGSTNVREFARHRASQDFPLIPNLGDARERADMAVDLNTSTDGGSAQVEPAATSPARAQVLNDDRWPDRLATAMFAFAFLVAVSTFITPLRHYFRRYDAVSMLTIPIVPNLVYAALLIAIGIALRRRLRAAWWIFVIWWIVLPQIVRIVSLATGGSLIQIGGLVIMSAVFVILWRARHQFHAHGRPRNLLAAIICFLVGSAVVLVLGTWLVSSLA